MKHFTETQLVTKIRDLQDLRKLMANHPSHLHKTDQFITEYDKMLKDLTGRSYRRYSKREIAIMASSSYRKRSN